MGGTLRGTVILRRQPFRNSLESGRDLKLPNSRKVVAQRHVLAHDYGLGQAWEVAGFLRFSLGSGPGRLQRAGAVRAKLAELDLSDQDMADAVAWARKKA